MLIDKYQEITGEALTSFQQDMLATLYVDSFITFIKEDRKISEKEIEDLLIKIREFISQHFLPTGANFGIILVLCGWFAELAQLVEHLPRKEKVASSTLAFSIRVLLKSIIYFQYC